MASNITIKWLGVAGIALSIGDETILIDPLFTRAPLMKAAFGKIAPDEAAIQADAPRCGHIFITHAHYDHMLDAPLIANLTGAALHAPPNACAIAAAFGVPAGRLYADAPGSAFTSGPFSVRAFQSSHIRLPGFGYGKLPQKFRLPLRAAQYRMDFSLVYLVECGGYRILIGPGLCLGDPGSVDILMCCPLYLGRNLTGYVSRIHPRVFIPIHWEDFFRPVNLPMKPGFNASFPFGRLDMDGVERQVKSLGVHYFRPERRKEYLLQECYKQGGLS